MDAAENSGKTAPHLATEGGHAETVKWLLESLRDRDGNPDTKDESGKTVLVLYRASLFFIRF